MSDQATIQEIQNIRRFGQVVMIRQKKLKAEVEVQAGNIAEALLSESMKSLKSDEARMGFLQARIESILNKVGTIYQCTEFKFVATGSQGFALIR